MRESVIFIPSLGIITEIDYINMPITLAYSARNVYKLVRDTANIFTSREMLVQRTIEIDSKAIITLSHSAGMIQPSAEALADYHNRVENALSKLDDDEAPKKRRKKRDEEDDISAEANIEALTSPMVHEIVVSRTVLDQEPTPIQMTKPFQVLAEKHEETLLTNLSRLARHVALRGEALQHLRAPSSEDVESAVSDLLPDIGESSIEAINRSGLANYEEKLRRDVSEQETRIHKIYDWFEEKVIDRYNNKSNVMSGVFTEEEKTIAEVTISRQELLTSLFKDEIIFLNKTTSKK